jgi:hypothetical protein
MNFPRNRMRFVRTHEGSVSAAGWLELDVRAVDLEGASKVFIDLAEVDRMRAAGDQSDQALETAKRLLGG